MKQATRERLGALPALAAIAGELAARRRSSVVLLEITREGSSLFAEDASALREGDGRVAVTLAMVTALREMLILAELELVKQRATQ
jgi:hypothetical protein